MTEAADGRVRSLSYGVADALTRQPAARRDRQSLSGLPKSLDALLQERCGELSVRRSGGEG